MLIGIRHYFAAIALAACLLIPQGAKADALLDEVNAMIQRTGLENCPVPQDPQWFNNLGTLTQAMAMFIQALTDYVGHPIYIIGGYSKGKPHPRKDIDIHFDSLGAYDAWRSQTRRVEGYESYLTVLENGLKLGGGPNFLVDSRIPFAQMLERKFTVDTPRILFRPGRVPVYEKW